MALHTIMPSVQITPAKHQVWAICTDVMAHLLLTYSKVRMLTHERRLSFFQILAFKTFLLASKILTVLLTKGEASRKATSLYGW